MRMKKNIRPLLLLSRQTPPELRKSGWLASAGSLDICKYLLNSSSTLPPLPCHPAKALHPAARWLTDQDYGYGSLLHCRGLNTTPVVGIQEFLPPPERTLEYMNQWKHMCACVIAQDNQQSWKLRTCIYTPPGCASRMDWWSLCWQPTARLNKIAQQVCNQWFTMAAPVRSISSSVGEWPWKAHTGRYIEYIAFSGNLKNDLWLCSYSTI